MNPNQKESDLRENRMLKDVKHPIYSKSNHFFVEYPLK